MICIVSKKMSVEFGDASGNKLGITKKGKLQP
jgi:hypothetical protein